MARRSTGLYRPRKMDSPSVEKEFFGKSRLPRIGVADDGEGAAPADLGPDRTQRGFRRQDVWGEIGEDGRGRDRA